MDGEQLNCLPFTNYYSLCSQEASYKCIQLYQSSNDRILYKKGYTSSMTMPTDSMEKRPRIAALDILKGLAIFGIFYINLPIMGNPMFDPVKSSGGGKQAVEWFLYQFVEGTQRGILELLFGAGMLILTAKAMQPDGQGRSRNLPDGPPAGRRARVSV